MENVIISLIFSFCVCDSPISER